MMTTILRPVLFATAALTLLSACDGSGGGNSVLPPLKLSGPISMALAASDATEIDADSTVNITSTLSSFPQSILDDFATRFPDMVAEERYRRVNYSGGVIQSEEYGIEGESADDSVEVEASYSAEGNFLSSMTETDNVNLPSVVTDAIATLYPNVSIDESSQYLDDSGSTTYEVELETALSEIELTLDSNANLLTTTEEVTAAMVPAAVIANSQQELAGYDEVEYEKATNNSDGSVTYHADLESATDSVSVVYSESGEVVSITFEESI